MLAFRELCLQMDTQKGRAPLEGALLSLDPGETTGYCIFRDYELFDRGQLDTKDFREGVKRLGQFIHKEQFVDIGAICHLVVEDYRIYGWKKDQHTWSDLHTPRLIGAIETLAAMYGLDVHKQMAQLAKQFCSDRKLKEWGFWIKGRKHARDAIRHAVYYQLFRKECVER